MSTDAVQQQRAERFDALIDHHECRARRNYSRPATGALPRYALVSHQDGQGYFLVAIAGREQAATYAAADVTEGWQPHALYDLDRLDGDEPLIHEGDVVQYATQTEQGRWVVCRVEEEVVEGELARYLCLVPPGTDEASRKWDDWDHRVYEDEVTILERGQPDERLPVSYGVADVQVRVVFNTVAS